MDYIFIIILGALIGSFLGVVVVRLHSQKTFLWSRSECLSCNRVLRWFELIPLLSFIIQRGYCRKCKHKIPWQDFIIEIVTSVLFALVYYIAKKQFGFQSFLAITDYQAVLVLIRNLLAVSVLVVIFIYDLRYYLILDKVTLPAIGVIVVMNLFINNLAVNWQGMVLGALIIGGFFLLQFIVSKGRWIGGGDIRLGVLMGVLLGWPHSITALVVSYVLGAIIGIGMIVFGKKSMQSQIPFGTFLSIGAVVALLWSEEIIRWYSHLFI